MDIRQDLVDLGLAASMAEAQRLSEQGAVRVSRAGQEAVAPEQAHHLIPGDRVIVGDRSAVYGPEPPNPDPGVDLSQDCYQPLRQPTIDSDGVARVLSDIEARNLLQLGVNLLALSRQNRRKVEREIWDRLGFDQCAAAVAIAASVPVDQLPRHTL